MQPVSLRQSKSQETRSSFNRVSPYLSVLRLTEPTPPLGTDNHGWFDFLFEYFPICACHEWIPDSSQTKAGAHLPVAIGHKQAWDSSGRLADTNKTHEHRRDVDARHSCW